MQQDYAAQRLAVGVLQQPLVRATQRQQATARKPGEEYAFARRIVRRANQRHDVSRGNVLKACFNRSEKATLDEVGAPDLDAALGQFVGEPFLVRAEIKAGRQPDQKIVALGAMNLDRDIGTVVEFHLARGRWRSGAGNSQPQRERAQRQSHDH
ncbi:MAG: hypothetical protein GWO40_19325 [Gammaproteobacteria bacterium]|nr:hypothetical protein [Gammaproteobacteria bacterium]NIX03491.1 hypothetical protein [Gammaproteobacteria bacterium]NIX87672.1 hypothetical protein [Gammaproteobacteria bacterium]